MAYVNYIREITRFIAFASDAGLSGNERSFWYALMAIANERANGSDWPEDFISINNKTLLAKVPFSANKLPEIRNKLKQVGLIDFKPGRRNELAAKYKVLYFYAELSTGYTLDVESYHRNCDKNGNKDGYKNGNKDGYKSGNKDGNFNVNLNVTPNPCDDEDMRLLLTKGAAEAYRDHFGKPATAAEIDRMVKATQNYDMSGELLNEAVRMAAEAGAAYPAMYVLQLLRDWRYEYVHDMDDLTEYLCLKDACNGKNPSIGRQEAYDMALDAQGKREARARRRGLRAIG